MSNLISNCCGAEIVNEDFDICPECLEHCTFENIEDDPDYMSKEQLAEIKEENAEYFQSISEFNNNLLPAK